MTTQPLGPPSGAGASNTAPIPRTDADRQYLISNQQTLGDRMHMAYDMFEHLPKWHTTIKETVTDNTQMCMEAWCCAPCFAYSQRRELLAFTNENNSCCLRESIPRPGGCCSSKYDPPVVGWPKSWPVSPYPNSATMCLEAACCLPLFISSNRRLMSHRFHVVDSKEDIAAMAAAACCFCCFRRYCTGTLSCLGLHACLQTQQQCELSFHEKQRLARNADGLPGYVLLEPVLTAAAPQVEVMNDGTRPPSGKVTANMSMQWQPDINSRESSSAASTADTRRNSIDMESTTSTAPGAAPTGRTLGTFRMTN